MKTIPFYIILSLLLAQLVVSASACTVCGNCVSCGPDVMADSYLDEIDALMQNKVQSLGYPLAITRNATASAITYSIQYSSGLLIVLQLSLANMQIQLLSYSINNSVAVPSVSPAPSPPSYKTTSDGYYILDNFSNSTQVNEIMNYLSSLLKNSFTNFQLVGVQFSNASAVLYRLAFKVLPVSSALTSVIENVLVQYVGTNNILLIDSNYSSLSNNLSWTAIDNKVILSDTFIAAINTLLIRKYNNLLGNTPTIVSIASALPYYQIVYQVDSTNYSFIILYDYFQNRILQGNLTTNKFVTTYTQTTTTQPSSTQSTSQSSFSTSSSSSSSNGQSGSFYTQTASPSGAIQVNTYTPSSGSQTLYNGNSVITTPTYTVGTTVGNPQAYYTVTPTSTTQQTTSNTAVNGQAQTSTATTTSSVPSTSTPAPATTLTTTSTPSSAATSTTASSTSSISSSVSGTSSTSSSSTGSQASSVSPVLTSSSTSSPSNSQSTTQQIVQFESSPEVTSALNFLASIGQNISISQIQSVQKTVSSSIATYTIIIQLTNLGSVNITKAIFYQYVIQLSAAGNYSLQQASYTNLNPPNFVLLTIDEVKKDDNIKIIARYLLSQQYPMLSSSSQVLAVYRDIPYYQIVFQGSANTQLTFIILYGLNSSVQVMSATSRQVAPPQQTYAQAAAQAAANGQTSITGLSTQTTQNTQTTTQVQTTAQTQNNQPQTLQTTTTTSNQPSQTTQTAQTVQTTQTGQNAQTTLTQSSSSQAGQNNGSSQTVQPVLQQTQNQQTATTQQSTTNTQGVQASTSASQQFEPVFVQIKQVQSNASSTSTQTSATVSSTTTQSANTTQTASTATTPAQPSTTPSPSTSSTTTSTTITTTSSGATTTTASSNSQSAPSANTTKVVTSLNGYNHFAGPSDQFYAYAMQGMAQINQTLLKKGYQISQLAYKDIVYKLEDNILTILFKVEVSGLLFTYQYKGSLGSSYLLTSPVLPAAVQTSSDTQSYSPDSNTIISGGVTYQLAPASLSSQAYIQAYLNFLSNSDICYSRSNLVGIYVNSNNSNILFFRFRNATQYYNIVTNTVEIQRILAIYLADSNQSSIVTTPSSTSSTATSTASSATSSTSSGSTATTSTTSPSGVTLVNTYTPSSGSQTLFNGNSVITTPTYTVGTTVAGPQAYYTVTPTPTTINPANSNTPSATTTPATSSATTATTATTTTASTTTTTSQGATTTSSPQTTGQSSQSNQTQATQQSTQATQNAQATQSTQTNTTQTNSQSAQSSQTQAQTIFQATQNTQASQAQTSSAQSTQNVQTAPIKASQVITIVNVDPHCLCYDQNKCLKCAHRYYLSNNHCIQIPNQCLSYDINTGVCVKCLPGYSLLSNGLCQLDDVTAYYYEQQCFQCLGDYRLVNKRCVYAPVNDPKSPQYLQTKNPLCLSWNNGVCDECLPGTYLSSRRVCELVDPFCSLFDYAKQICNTCNDGFALRNGKCFTL